MLAGGERGERREVVFVILSEDDCQFLEVGMFELNYYISLPAVLLIVPRLAYQPISDLPSVS